MGQALVSNAWAVREADEARGLERSASSVPAQHVTAQVGVCHEVGGIRGSARPDQHCIETRVVASSAQMGKLGGSSATEA